MFRRLKEFNPDVVHVVNPMWLAGAAALVAERMGLPILGSFHTDVPEYTVRLGAGWLAGPSKWGIRQFHGRAQVNLVTSAPMLDKAAEYRIGNVDVWPKAVDTQSFSPDKRTREMRSRLSDGHPDAPLSPTSAGFLPRSRPSARSASWRRCASRSPTPASR